VHDEDSGEVHEIQVKQPQPSTQWVWGAFKLDGAILRDLHAVWLTRQPRDPYLGTLVNAWLAQGGRASAVRAGESYVDTGTLHGYREAMQLLARRDGRPPSRAGGEPADAAGEPPLLAPPGGP